MKKYKVGYTTGVFDLFHVGHLKILQKAKSFCEQLVVGVSNDELVKEYKGKHPIVNFEERVEIVEAIKYVDKVIPQSSHDKLKAWQEVQFNVLFHGDDWKNTPLYEKIQNDLNEKGVELIFLPYTKGISSSELKQKVFQDLVNE